MGIPAGALFLLWAAAFAYVAVRGRAGTLPKGSMVGLHSPLIEKSDETWKIGHEGGWVFMAAGGILATFHGAGTLIAVLLMGADGPRFAQPLVIMGVVVCVAMWWLAGKAADDAVKRSGKG